MAPFARTPRLTEQRASNSIHLSLPNEYPLNLENPTQLHRSVSPANSRATSSLVPAVSTPSKFSRWTNDWITDWWGAELICWIIAALSLLAMVVILESHKNHPPPEWPFHITINSLISIFATIGQMAMLKPVVECISQLKWLWFIRRNKLSDFQAFDNASRGPTGSLALLGKLRGLHLASLGAAIVVLSIAFGPFAQQIVTYPTRLHIAGNATTPLVLNFTGSNHNSTQGLVTAFSNSMANNSVTLSDVPSSCGTGDCSWDLYPSLGVCANVVDLSANIWNGPCDPAAFEDVFEVANITNPGYPCLNYTLPFQAYNNVLSQTTRPPQ